jgi:hypothetical protein
VKGRGSKGRRGERGQTRRRRRRKRKGVIGAHQLVCTELKAGGVPIQAFNGDSTKLFGCILDFAASVDRFGSHLREKKLMYRYPRFAFRWKMQSVLNQAIFGDK